LLNSDRFIAVPNRLVRINTPTKKWGIAWVSVAVALAVHVLDETLTGFLPFYNSIVWSSRSKYAWTPFPTFTFTEWIVGLTVGVVILLSLSPLVFSGYRFLRPISSILGIVMVANALGHIGVSIYLNSLVPGVYSAPILLISALALLIAVYRSRGSAQYDSHKPV
jgi:hypothetical protein